MFEWSRSTRRSSPFDTERARAADVVFEELERHPIADSKCIEGRALLQIAAVEEHLAPVCQPDEAVALPDEQRFDST